MVPEINPDRGATVPNKCLYRAAEADALPFVKIGQARRIPRRALIKYAASHLRGGGWEVVER